MLLKEYLTSSSSMLQQLCYTLVVDIFKMKEDPEDIEFLYNTNCQTFHLTLLHRGLL